jgi:hypothetical protein
MPWAIISAKYGEGFEGHESDKIADHGCFKVCAGAIPVDGAGTCEIFAQRSSPRDPFDNAHERCVKEVNYRFPRQLKGEAPACKLADPFEAMGHGQGEKNEKEIASSNKVYQIVGEAFTSGHNDYKIGKKLR